MRGSSLSLLASSLAIPVPRELYPYGLRHTVPAMPAYGQDMPACLRRDEADASHGFVNGKHQGDYRLGAVRCCHSTPCRGAPI